MAEILNVAVQILSMMPGSIGTSTEVIQGIINNSIDLSQYIITNPVVFFSLVTGITGFLAYKIHTA